MNTEHTAAIKKLILEAQQVPSIPRLAEIAVELSGWYATISEKFNDIETFRAERWLDIRQGVKSDAVADKTFLASAEGKTWQELRNQLKYVEKVIGTIRLRLKIAEGESFNRY